MSEPRALLFVAREAGSAAALAPVVSLAIEDGDRVAVRASGAAGGTFAAAGLPFELLEEDVPAGKLPTAEARPDGLITGTSTRPDIEGAIWGAARSAGIPSVAVLDHWANYAERFSLTEPFDRLPDRIAVMDDLVRDAFLAAGCPPGRLLVTGHPHLDALEPIAAGEREDARRLLGVAEERAVVVFASQPLARLYGDSGDSERFLGYTERDSLATTSEALARIAPGALLALKLHPLEADGAFDVPAGPPELRVLPDQPPRQAIAAADAVAGITSSLLLEAARSGVAALSVRPGGGPDRFVDAHADEIAIADSADAAAAAIARALSGPPPPPRPPRRPSPARAVLEAVRG